MCRMLIDREAVSGFDDPAWLDDLWMVATKKFGGMRIPYGGESRDRRCKVNVKYVVTACLMDKDTLTEHTERTEFSDQNEALTHAQNFAEMTFNGMLVSGCTIRRVTTIDEYICPFGKFQQ